MSNEERREEYKDVDLTPEQKAYLLKLIAQELGEYVEH